MRRVRDFCSVLFAILWLVASSHPALESAGLIHQGDRQTHDTTTPQDDDGDNDHDAADGKCPINYCKISIPDPPTLFGFITAIFSMNDLVARPALEIDSSGLAPPEQSAVPLSSWQFCLRAALAPRAPSILS